MADKVFSRDEETFYDEWSDVLDMLDSDDELVPGAIIYEGEKVEKKPSDYAPDAGDIMEHLSGQAWDHAGEHADGWPHDSMPKDKQAELEKLLHDWLNSNLNVTFWTVTNIRKLELTEADIAEYRETPEAQALQREAATIASVASGKFTFDPACTICHGKGSFVAGYSGREDDGNAPIWEQCDCFIPADSAADGGVQEGS